MSVNVLRRMARVESSGNYRAVPRDPKTGKLLSSAKGLFQFIDSTWDGLAARYKHLGLTDVFDPVQQARAAPHYLKEIQDHLTRKLKRKPTDGELYLGWFLGPEGASTAASFSPDTPIHLAVRPGAIAANRAVFNKVQTVADLWKWADGKMSSSSPLPTGAPSLAGKYAAQGMSLDPHSLNTSRPISEADDYNTRRAMEAKAYSFVKAAAETAKLDWSISNLLAAQGKTVYDPNWKVTNDHLLKDDRVKALPSHYLRHLTSSTSEQDFEFRLRQAQKDFDVEQRLAATPYGMGIRIAVNMADPGGIALAALAPFGGMAAGAGRLARVAATAADGALGATLAEVPLALNKPGYETQQMLWAAALGSGSYVALNRSWAQAAPHVADDAEKFIAATAKIQEGIQNGTFGSGSAGAAQNIIREAVIGDIEDWSKLMTEKTAFGAVRFDVAKLKNSENPVVAAIVDRLALDTVGNKNKSKAVTRAIEEDKRFYEQRANIYWSRIYDVSADKYRERKGISYADWKLTGEDEFQRKITHAKRNTDPTVEIDPEVQQMATAWKTMDEFWREHARNPGKLSGETMRPISGADSWADDPNYVPRFVNWERWQELTMEFGDEGIKNLLRKAIAAKNPDMDPNLAHKLGGWYYQRIRDVEAGQEMTASRVFSGLDVERMRRSLQDELGLNDDEVGKVLYQATARDEGKGITNRQKMRTHMDENYSLMLSGKNGSRAVTISEIWEDNSRSIIHAYNHQMAGAVALGRFRVENPNFKKGVDPDEKQWLVDGIHKEADWAELLKKARAVDNHLRPTDRGQTVEAEIRNLQWLYETIAGVPNSFDRTKWGQLSRIAQGINFTRLMPQAGFASVAEIGMVAASTGWKHMLKSLPGLRDFKRNALTGKLLRDELEDWEYVFMVGTDDLRGVGMNMRANNVATGQIEPNMSRKLDTVERGLGLATRMTSRMSLAPVTTYEERLALKAAIGKFREAANTDGKGLREQRMRLLGLDEDLQKRVLANIKKHSTKIKNPDTGREVEILGLDKWDEQVRSAFELAINRNVRRMIQQNDLGQMNYILGHPVAKLLTQFRSFSIGAWSKNTLSNIHMRDWESVNAVFASAAFGGLAYITQTYSQSLGLPEKDRKKFLEERLSDKKIAAAHFQRTGFSSLIPGVADFGLGLVGLDPLFDTRSTGQPTQGWAANPTTGLIDSAYGAIRELGQTVGGEEYSSKDFRQLMSVVNPFHKYPLMLQTINATSGAFPEE